MKLAKRLAPMAIAATLAATLSACGGGGGSAPNSTAGYNPAVSGFPIQQALTYAFTHGLQANLVIGGTATYGAASYPLSGSLTYTVSGATNATFEGAAALKSTESLNATISINGQSQPLTMNSPLYLNMQYAPIGSTDDGSYCVAAGTPVYPVTAVAGQSGDIVTMNCYTDSTKRTLIDVAKMSYVTTAGSDANSINFQMITTDYGLTSTPQSTTSITFTITAAGIPTLTRVQGTQVDSGVTVNLDAH